MDNHTNENLSSSTEVQKNTSDNGVPRYRVLRTALSLLGFTCCGIAYAVTGPTLVNMQVLLDTDTTHISIALSAHHIGYLCAAIACGILSDKLDSELQLFVGLLLGGLACIAAPWIPSVVGFAIAIGIKGLGIGYSDIEYSVFLMKL